MQICRGLAQAMDVLQGRWLDCRDGVESSFSLEDWASTLRLKPLKDKWASMLWQHVFACQTGRLYVLVSFCCCCC